MTQLHGKVAVVTGGSRGIGQAIALALGRAGVRVAITCVQQRAAAEAVAQTLHQMGSDGRVYQFDVADFAATTSAFDQIVKDFGGTIRALSREGEGASFIISFPAAEG